MASDDSDALPGYSAEAALVASSAFFKSDFVSAAWTSRVSVASRRAEFCSQLEPDRDRVVCALVCRLRCACRDWNRNIGTQCGTVATSRADRGRTNDHCVLERSDNLWN